MCARSKNVIIECLAEALLRLQTIIFHLAVHFARALKREREREIQPYVHSANVAYEDKSLFMSQPIEGWLSGNQNHPRGPCATQTSPWHHHCCHKHQHGEL